MSTHELAVAEATIQAHTASPPTTTLGGRRCACGGIPGPSGECAQCRARRLAGRPAPRLGDDVSSDQQTTTPPAAPATPAPAAPATPPAPTPPAPCAHPVNWRHFNPRDHGPDAIRVDLTWESSTGNLADLGNCQWREVVRYDPIPNPPFLWNPPNPTIIELPSTGGAGIDTHSYPPGLRDGITNPRQPGTMVAHQVYQWRCTAPGCPTGWTDFPNQRYTITREVFPQYVRLNPWRYKITKQGVGNLFSYSREVEIPEPVTPPAPPPGPGPAPAPAPTPPAPTPGPTPGPTPAGSSIQVCSRDLQGALGLFANHAYVDAPPFRYAIISPLCPAHWYDNPVTGTTAQKWDNSPDPCGKTPRCVPCLPKPGVTNVASCLRNAFLAYNHPSLYKALGPNSNTFAGTLARACCAGMVPKPGVLGNCPGWDDPPAPARAGATPCPPGPTC